MRSSARLAVAAAVCCSVGIALLAAEVSTAATVRNVSAPTTHKSSDCVSNHHFFSAAGNLTPQLVAAINRALGTSLTAAEILQILPGSGGPLPVQVARQLITAEANIASGAKPSATVLQALQRAIAGLRFTVTGGVLTVTSTLSNTVLSELTTAITRFNDGFAGTPRCTPLSHKNGHKK